LDEPAQREGGLTAGTDVDRDLVGRTADTTALDLEARLDVVERALERDDRIGAGLLTGALEGGVDDALRDLLLAVEQDLVDQLGDQLAAVDRIGLDRTLRSGTLTRHQLFSFFAA